MPDEAYHMWYQYLLDDEVLKVRGVAIGVIPALKV